VHHDPDFIGCLQVHPPLNEAELDFLAELVESGRTLRGTPTGRGRAEVPFARSAWDACEDGCCLWWDPEMGEERWLVETLEFIVDHLLRPGAIGAGHPRLAGFAFDHVLRGVVAARLRTGAILVEVTDNLVSSRSVRSPCGTTLATSETCLSRSAARRSPLPANVVELRPRRA
jgi:hypothetical protein